MSLTSVITSKIESITFKMTNSTNNSMVTEMSNFKIPSMSKNTK